MTVFPAFLAAISVFRYAIENGLAKPLQPMLILGYTVSANKNQNITGGQLTPHVQRTPKGKLLAGDMVYVAAMTVGNLQGSVG